MTLYIQLPLENIKDIANIEHTKIRTVRSAQ